MDGLGSHYHDNEPDVSMDAPPLVRFDERRMHVRAYNYWASLLGDRSFPSIEDLNPEEIEDFGSHSVLLDFTDGIDNPGIAFLGSALMRECGLEEKLARIRDVPSRTLLSRLTDHYLQIIANQAPIGFEAEFTNQRGAEILYRGILMPFSSDDDTIDFVYGVINWKEVASAALTDDIIGAIGALAFEDGALPEQLLRSHDAAPAAIDEDALELTDLAPADDAYLSDELCQTLADAQGAAADAITAEGRTRAALYRAVGLAHSFALIAAAQAADYAALLEDAGIAVAPRSPMTALVKLVFGSHYDKTRLSEFATAIEAALAEGLEPGALTERLTRHEGGLKAYVRDARAAKRGPVKARPDARARFVAAHAVADAAIATDADGLAVVVVRRLADGGFETLGGLAADDKRAGQVLRAVARG